jgi:4-carboxymuconolactone decarboxylase
MDQQYEWAAHEPAALNEGVSQAIVDAIKYFRDTNSLPRESSLIIRYVRELFNDHSLSATTWAEAVLLFGQQGAVEIAAIMGDYAMILNAIDQRIPGERPAPMPIQ